MSTHTTYGRAKLEDDLLDGEEIDHDYPHLYSNCLVSYVGDIKEFSMTQSSRANSAMEKFVLGYKNDPSIRQEIEDMDESNVLVRRLKEAIRLKAVRPDLEHGEQYPHKMLQEIAGSLEIVGLSPNNDRHLFTYILENDGISDIRFNYFGRHEAREAERLFHSKSLTTRDVRELWAQMRAPRCS